MRRDQISAAVEEGVRLLGEQLAERARVAGRVTWRREFYYTASQHGVDEGAFTTSAE